MSTLVLADWLVILQGQLDFLSVSHLALIEGADAGTQLRWCPLLPPSARLIGASAPVAAADSGWLLSWPGASPAPARQLFIATRRELAPDDSRLLLGTAVCHLGLQLWQEHERRISASWKPIHALRNGLNGVAMTAAVLAASEVPEVLEAFVDDLQPAVHRCLQALAELSAVITPDELQWPAAGAATSLRTAHGSSRPATSSPIASAEVRPGDSMPNSSTSPGRPWA